MRQRRIWLGLTVGIGTLVLAGLLSRTGQVAPTTEARPHAAGSSSVEGGRAGVLEPLARLSAKSKKGPPAAAGTPARSPVSGQANEAEHFLYLGTRGEVVLERDKLKLVKIWEDGTTQYRYDDQMVVTILANGEILLMPDEI